MRWLTNLLLIRDEERSPVLYYMALFVLLGVGLSLGRGSMAALFLKRYGVQYLPVMYAVLSVFMVMVGLTYAAYADRIAAEKLFVKILAVLGMLILASWGLMSFTTGEWVYPAYYLVYELASELLIIHAKLYVDQNFDSLQLQRLSSPILASAIVGKSAGGLFLGLAAPLVGVANMLPVWTAIIAIAALLIIWRHVHVGTSPYFQSGRKRRGSLKQSVEQVTQGFKFFRKTKMVRAVSYSLFFMVITLFILDYSVDRVLTETIPREDQLASFIGWMTAIMGAVALLVQLLLTGRLLRRFGVTRIGLVSPVSGVVSFLTLLFSFSLPAALVGIFSRDVIFTAIRKPTRLVFLHALPGYMTGRINALSVGLVLPLALLVTSGFILLTQNEPKPSYFVGGGVFASLMYLYFRVRANRAYTPALLATLSHKLFLPHRHSEDLLHPGNEELCAELLRGVAGPDENSAIAYARMLTAVSPEQALHAIAGRLPAASYPARDRLLRLLIGKKLPVSDILWSALGDTDLHLKATILDALFDVKDQRALGHVAECLRSDSPRLAAIGVFGALRYPLADLEPLAQQTWERLLSGQHDAEKIAGLELLARIPDQRRLPQLRELLQHSSTRVRQAALNASSRFPQGTLADFAPVLMELYNSDEPDIRALCVTGYPVLDPETRRALCMRALEDEHHSVRAVALSLLEACEGRSEAVEVISKWILENRGFPRAQQSALTALSRYRLPGEVFERIAESKVREACALSLAKQVIRHERRNNAQTNSVLELLEVVLQERVTQVIDVALMAMENFADRTAIATIRAGVASRDRRHVAHACEALHNLCGHGLSGPLIALVDNGEMRGMHDAQGETFRNARDVIAWCLRHPDPWLRECAARASPSPLTAGA